MQNTCKAKLISATGQVPGTSVPSALVGIIVTGGATASNVTLTDGNGGPKVGYVNTAAATSSDFHFDIPIFCANGIFVSAFANGGGEVFVRHL